MKYKITVASNTSDFYSVALMEIASGPKRFKSINYLLQTLSPGSPLVTLASIEKLFQSGGTIAIIICKKRVVGLATLVTVTKINSVTGRIEHVVIDPSHRGKHLSRKLMMALIEVARSKRLRYIDLTTEPKRIEANNLYLSLDFVKRETNPYRLKL